MFVPPPVAKKGWPPPLPLIKGDSFLIILEASNSFSSISSFEIKHDINTLSLDFEIRIKNKFSCISDNRKHNSFIDFGSKSNDKVFISCFISKNIITKKELDASKIIKELSPLISGSGGGQSFYATGGGTNTDGIDSVISEAEKIISQI